MGLTGVHDMGIEDATADVYRALAARRELPLRVYAFLSGDPADLPRLGRGPAPAAGRFELRGVKFFADGALGSRGARLYADYDDDRGNRGLWVTAPEALAAAVDAATRTGWQVAVHAIGDAAVGSVLDAFGAAQKKYPGDHRPRIEHLQIIAPEDLPRLVEARAIASMQPTHATSDMPWAEQRIGAERVKGAYAWRTVLDKGVPLGGGLGLPVEEVSPLLGIYAAVTRQDGSGAPPGGWYPAQRMTLDEALAAFTYGAAYAGFAEDTRGRIAVGRLADLTVFDGALAPDRSLLERQGRADDRRRRGGVRSEGRGGERGADGRRGPVRFCPFCSAENGDELAVCQSCSRRLPPLPPRRVARAPGGGVQVPPRTDLAAGARGVGVAPAVAPATAPPPSGAATARGPPRCRAVRRCRRAEPRAVVGAAEPPPSSVPPREPTAAVGAAPLGRGVGGRAR